MAKYYDATGLQVDPIIVDGVATSSLKVAVTGEVTVLFKDSKLLSTFISNIGEPIEDLAKKALKAEPMLSRLERRGGKVSEAKWARKQQMKRGSK